MLTTQRSFQTLGLSLPRSARADITASLFCSLLIAISAQIAVRIPLSPVPITAQTFTILLLAYTLGRKRAVMSVVLYLAEGTAGLPVFAGGGAGAAWLLGPTGGYLLGFVLAALVVGYLGELDRSHAIKALIAFTAGHLVIYLAGAGWLSFYTGLEAALQTGVLPFLIGDAMKIVVGAVSVPQVRRYLV